MRFFAGPALLVIDELGYLPLPGSKSALPAQRHCDYRLRFNMAVSSHGYA